MGNADRLSRHVQPNHKVNYTALSDKSFSKRKILYLFQDS